VGTGDGSVKVFLIYLKFSEVPNGQYTTSEQPFSPLIYTVSGMKERERITEKHSSDSFSSGGHCGLVNNAVSQNH